MEYKFKISRFEKEVLQPGLWISFCRLKMALVR